MDKVKNQYSQQKSTFKSHCSVTPLISDKLEIEQEK
jgi:hypothetical protein